MIGQNVTRDPVRLYIFIIYMKKIYISIYVMGEFAHCPKLNAGVFVPAEKSRESSASDEGDGMVKEASL